MRHWLQKNENIAKNIKAKYEKRETAFVNLELSYGHKSCKKKLLYETGLILLAEIWHKWYEVPCFEIKNGALMHFVEKVLEASRKMFLNLLQTVHLIACNGKFLQALLIWILISLLFWVFFNDRLRDKIENEGGFLR